MSTSREAPRPRWLVPIDEAHDAVGADGGAPAGLLADCRRSGLSVPEGFVLTRALRDEAARAGGLPKEFRAAIDAALAWIERATGTWRDHGATPLLVDLSPDADGGRAVGFRRLGLSRRCRDGLAARTGDPEGADRALVERVVEHAVRVHGVPDVVFEGAAAERPAAALSTYELFVGAPFPESLEGQLEDAVEVLLETERLRLVHRLGKVRAGWRGPGLLVTASVVGAAGAESGTGRLRWNGGRAGDVTVRFRPDADALEGAPALDEAGLRRVAPRIFGQLDVARRLIERSGEPPLGFDFVGEAGRLFVVAVARSSARPSGRDATAAPGEAPAHEPARPPDRPRTPARRTSLMDDAVIVPVAHGNRIASGVASGRLVFTAATALHCRRAGVAAVLVVSGADEEDLVLPPCAALLLVGVSDARAKSIAGGAGRPAIALSDEVRLDARAACLRLEGQLLREGDPVTVDADGSRLFLGELAVEEPDEPDEPSGAGDPDASESGFEP